MSEKKENREEEKERSSSRSDMTDEQIETALNACMFGQTKADRCKDCPLDSDKEPCMTNLHLAALEYIGRLKERAEEAEKSLEFFDAVISNEIMNWWEKEFFVQPGEIVYIPWVKNGNSGIAELPIVDIRVYKGRDIWYRVDLSRCDGEYMWTAPKPFYSHSEFGHTIFTIREAAEARLAELKGEKGCAKT